MREEDENEEDYLDYFLSLSHGMGIGPGFIQLEFELRGVPCLACFEEEDYPREDFRNIVTRVMKHYDFNPSIN